MLTILEVDDFWSLPDEHVRRSTAEKIRTLEQRDDLRYVFVQAGRQRYAEARGRHVVIEHIERSRVPQRPLTELIQLHRPTVIVSRAAVVMLLSIGLASVRLVPRPVLIGRWRGLGVGDRRAWKLIQRVRGFDGVFVANHGEAREAAEHGLDRDRLHLVARDDFAGEVTKMRAILEDARAGLHRPRRTP